MGFFSHITHSISHAAHRVEHTASHTVSGVVHQGAHVVKGVEHKATSIAHDPLNALTGGMPNKLMMAGGVLVAVMLLK